MKLSSAGLAIIKRFEALRLKAYLDGGGVPTIGYGHTKGVKMGDTCTEAQADAWAIDDSTSAVAAINAALKVPVNQNQFDALVSFTYNVGNQAFRDSTMLKLLNVGDFNGAAAQFPRWNKDNFKVVKGLTNRRAAEQKLFQTPV